MSAKQSSASVFWALVRNDLKRDGHHAEHWQSWQRFYIGLAILVNVVLYSWAVLKGVMKIELLLLAIPAFYFLPIGFSWRVIKKEWHYGTSGWWLTLPYNRRLLLGAKAFAVFLHYLRTFLVFVSIILFFVIEAVWLRPDL